LNTTCGSTVPNSPVAFEAGNTEAMVAPGLLSANRSPFTANV
jgi:hypothetical protein